MKKRVYFELERETKNMVRYQEVNADGEVVEKEDAKIPTIYISKKLFKGMKEMPEQIEIVVIAE